MNPKKQNNLLLICVCILLVVIMYLVMNKYNSSNSSNSSKVIINNNMVKDKYESLVSIIGQPTYIETNNKNELESAKWMSPLNEFNDFGKFGGCDYIKIHGTPAQKYHPHKAIVFLIVGKYIKVPKHLFGPLKHASETINIEQLFIPEKYQLKYKETGVKDVALVTGSCASITISVITIQFAIDMIKKYKDNKNKSLELYKEFRTEYDRRIHNYLCGKGITNKIDWFKPETFNETSIYNIGEEKCNSVEFFYTGDNLKKEN